MPNRILAGPAGFEPYEPITEIVAAVAILPGALIVADGNLTDADDVFSKQVFVATERGQHTGAGVNTAYGVGELTFAAALRPGNLAWVRGTSGIASTEGTLYTAGANGRLVVVTTEAQVPLFAAFSDVNGATVASNDTLVLVKKL